MNKTTC